MKFEKLTAKAEKELEALSARCQEAADEKYKGLIAEKILQDAMKYKTEMAAVLAALGIMLEEGWVGNAREEESRARGKIGSAKMATMRLAKQLGDAADMDME